MNQIHQSAITKRYFSIAFKRWRKELHTKICKDLNLVKELKSIKEEWNTIIAAKLKDGVAIDDLKHEYTSGIMMEPNVMASDLENYNHEVNPSKPWINMATIKSGSSLDKNRLALQALQEGANGLNIVMSGQDSIEDILKDILTKFLDVRVDCRHLREDTVKFQKSLINVKDYPNVRWVNQGEDYDQFHIYTQNRIHDIKIMVNVIGQNIPTDIIISLSKNLLFEIASIRAIRVLVDELKIKDYNIIAVIITLEGS